VIIIRPTSLRNTAQVNYYLIISLGLVPLVACPLSDIVYGRHAIYRVGIKYCGRVIGRRAGRLISQSGQLEKVGEPGEGASRVRRWVKILGRREARFQGQTAGAVRRFE